MPQFRVTLEFLVDAPSHEDAIDNALSQGILDGSSAEREPEVD